MRTILLAVVCALTMALPARGQSDASGTWDLNFNTQNGPMSASMTLKKDGDKLAGTMTGPQGEVAVEGTRRDKAIALSLSVQTQNGPLAISLTGTAQTEKPADVAGDWALQIDTGQGTTGTPSVTFKQDGEKLTGTYHSQVVGEQELTGTIKGNAITFSIKATLEGNALTVTYSGTVDKDTMKGKVTFGDLGEGTFTGKKK